MPEAQPCTRLRPLLRAAPGISRGRRIRPDDQQRTVAAKSLKNFDMALELGAVARMTLAPPNFFNFSAAQTALLSI